MNEKITRQVEEFLCDKIEAMDAKELQAAIRECDSLTTTNCSWIRYGLRRIIKEVAESQLSGLTKAADLLPAIGGGEE